MMNLSMKDLSPNVTESKFQFSTPTDTTHPTNTTVRTGARYSLPETKSYLGTQKRPQYPTIPQLQIDQKVNNSLTLL